MKNKYMRYLVKYILIFIIAGLLIIMTDIVFSDDPLTWGKFFRTIPYMFIAGIIGIVIRSSAFK